MCHYNNNVLTMNYKRNTKTTIHWILQVLGGGCGIAGVLLKCIKDDFYFFNMHTKLGKRERERERETELEREFKTLILIHFLLYI